MPSSRRTWSAPTRCSRRPARSGSTETAAAGSALPPRVHRRGVRLARSRRSAVPRDHAVRPELALRREQGGLRSPGARVSPHLRAAGHHQQLLQQLRSLPVSREADPAHAGERAGRQGRCPSTATGGTCATGSTSRTTAGRWSRSCCGDGSERPTTSAAGTSGRTSTSSACSAAWWTRRSPAESELRARFPQSPAARGGKSAAAHHLREGSPGTRPALRHRRQQDRAGARVLSRGELRDRDPEDGGLVSAPTRRGGARDGRQLPGVDSAPVRVRIVSAVKETARRVLPTGVVRGLSRVWRGVDVAVAEAATGVLRRLPLRVAALTRERWIATGRLDYPAAPIVLAIDSEAELSPAVSSGKNRRPSPGSSSSFRPGDVVFGIGANVGAYSLVVDRDHPGPLPRLRLRAELQHLRPALSQRSHQRVRWSGGSCPPRSLRPQGTGSIQLQQSRPGIRVARYG